MRQAVRFVVALVIGAVLAWGVWFGVARSLYTPKPEWTQDSVNLMNIGGQLETYESLPAAADGRVDVYRIVKDGAVPERRAVDLFRSARTGIGPSLQEIRAGDYTHFPYVRARVPVRSGEALIWDHAVDPTMKLRMVLFRDGKVRRVEADWAPASRESSRGP